MYRRKDGQLQKENMTMTKYKIYTSTKIVSALTP